MQGPRSIDFFTCWGLTLFFSLLKYCLCLTEFFFPSVFSFSVFNNGSCIPTGLELSSQPKMTLNLRSPCIHHLLKDGVCDHTQMIMMGDPAQSFEHAKQALDQLNCLLSLLLLMSPTTGYPFPWGPVPGPGLLLSQCPHFQVGAYTPLALVTIPLPDTSKPVTPNWIYQPVSRLFLLGCHVSRIFPNPPASPSQVALSPALF